MGGLGTVLHWDGTAWSLVPPLLALVLAVATRKVVPALAAGGLAGTVLLAWLEGRSPAWGLLDFVQVGLLGRVSDPGNAQVIVLILLVGGFGKPGDPGAAGGSKQPG